AESSGNAFGINRELNKQLAILAQISKTQKMPIVVTSQVRSVFNESYTNVAPVATRVLKFWAETIIFMKPTENSQIIKAVLEKNGEAALDCYLKIDETGIHDYPFH
ncbi:MAG: hypothetical protein NWE80_03940, partial [Candidatus Bathyarchaeota archaeon]|nr:hypothetical protein [Candidatus Bathyarchaeota archaeon]